ncbi:polysaccharide deacetylase family protein [Bacillus timonensis]|uniref:N-acetyltransferase GCN5 n=1 Tax=Bacillus timonensis TaxID=1033734 RepID=UPI000289405A|nr:N-acetyltransferase GCN5 [Bacillus timonensis]
MNAFSYKEYGKIISDIKKHNKVIDFREVTKDTEQFCVIRHDVEFSVERAFEMAKIESELGVKSSYMFQIRNNAYNLFSSENINMVRQIKEMGHHIGLHVHLKMVEEFESIESYILNDVQVMEAFLNIPVDRFSYHRPPKDILKLKVRINNLINTYDDIYFDLKEDEDNFENVRIKYFSDSMHQWKYGYPSEEEIKKYKKIQLLVHPYSWTKKGYPNTENFYSLKDEKVRIFNSTIHSECNHFKMSF